MNTLHRVGNAALLFDTPQESDDAHQLEGAVGTGQVQAPNSDWTAPTRIALRRMAGGSWPAMRWNLTNPLSYRDVDAWLALVGVSTDDRPNAD